MSTPPISRLQTRLADARRLIEIHEECTGTDGGRRHNYDALNRSVIVLSVAAWEGFSEDILTFASLNIARRSLKPSVIPEGVRHAMLAHYHESNNWQSLDKSTKDDIWGFAGGGWRGKYFSYAKNRIERLNTPNHENLRKNFSSIIGLRDFSSNWGARRWRAEDYIDRIDALLRLRHRIAHGTIGSETVGKGRASKSIQLIERAAGWTDHAVSDYLKSLKLSRLRFKI